MITGERKLSAHAAPAASVNESDSVVPEVVPIIEHSPRREAKMPTEWNGGINYEKPAAKCFIAKRRPDDTVFEIIWLSTRIARPMAYIMP